MTTIKLSNNVRVSDPCYDDSVWCKTRLTDVYPGEYNVIVEKSDEGGWGNRVSRVSVIHKAYVMECEDESLWQEHSEIGVDSGQAGIFCETSYRKDELAESITAPELEQPFVLPYDGGSYIQAPFEDCTEEEYERLFSKLQSIDLSKVVELQDNTDLSGELACAGGACEIK